MSNTLDFIQIYVVTNTEYHNLCKTEFKVKSCSEALIHLEASSQHCVTKSYTSMYIHKGNIYIYIYCVFIGIPVIYYFPYNPEILVNK